MMTMTTTRSPRAVGRRGGKKHLPQDRPSVCYCLLLFYAFLCDWLTAATASKRPSPAAVNYLSTDDDDSGYEYGTKRKAKTQKKKRRRVVDFDEPAELRFSTRRAAKITSYNEDDDDFEENEEEGDAQGGYVYQEEEEASTTGIDVVLDHRPREGVGKWRYYPPPGMY